MKTTHNQRKLDGGYTLLFAVLVSSIVLGVALSILSISRRELLLSSNARESQFAFYAADSGLECASYNDLVGNVFSGGSSPAITCKGVANISVSSNSINSDETVYTYTFNLPVDNVDAGTALPQMCASVTVVKDVTVIRSLDAATGNLITTGTNVSTVIDSDGYNVGWNPNLADPTKGDCLGVSVRKVQRSLHLVH